MCVYMSMTTSQIKVPFFSYKWFIHAPSPPTLFNIKI